MKIISKNSKRESVVDRTLRINQEQVDEICQMLKCSEQDYFNNQFEQYEVFLKRMLHASHITFYAKVRFSPIMRGFWNNEWIKRNAVFLKKARYELFSGLEVDVDGVLYEIEPPDEATEAKVYDDYMTIHNGKLLATNHDLITRFEHVLNLIFKK